MKHFSPTSLTISEIWLRIYTKIIKSKFQISGISSKLKNLTFRQDGHHPGTLVLVCDNFCTIPVDHLWDLALDIHSPTKIYNKMTNISEIWLRIWEKIPQNNKVQISNFRHFVKYHNFDIPTRRASSWDPGAYVWQLLYDLSRPSLTSGPGHGPTPQIYNNMTTENSPNSHKLQILTF